MITFQNPGLIDIDAAVTIGVNVKETESPIGYFGTGLKYAIARILSWNGSIIIWRGLQLYEFEAKPQVIRGKVFSIVYMNGERLGFSTDYGKNWQPWQVFRELYSNCLDEGGKTFGKKVLPRSEVTTIQVECPALDEVFQNKQSLLINDEPLFVGSAGTIHAGASSGIFYRGIRASTTSKPCLYRYNLTAELPLTEDRTIRDSWRVDTCIASLVDELCQKGFTDIAERIMCPDVQNFESTIHFGLISQPKYSDAFYSQAQKLCKNRAGGLNCTLRALLERDRPSQAEPAELHLTAIQRQVLETARAFVKELRIPIDNFPIVCVEGLGSGVLGEAHGGKIYITGEAFGLGTKTVAGTLIEEYIHLHTGAPDFSRQLQEELLQRLVSLGEEHIWKRPL